jgi:ribonuclease Z
MRSERQLRSRHLIVAVVVAMLAGTAFRLWLAGTGAGRVSEAIPEARAAGADTAASPAVSTGAGLPQYFTVGERLRPDEMRVTVVGSGMPDVRRGQVSGSMLVELGNGEVLLFDVGTGSVMNLNSLRAEGKVTKVFLSHLHTDHAGDLDALWVSAISQREEVLTVYGPSSLTPEYGTGAFVENFQRLWYWDRQSRTGILSTTGMAIEAREFDYSKVQVVYERNGVKVTSFPAIHAIDGPVSYRLDWNGLSFVFSGDTIPNKWLIEQARGVDLLIHESFPSPEVYSAKSGYPLRVARNIAAGVHTTPAGLGKILAMTRPRMAGVYHLLNNFDVVQATLEEIRRSYDGALVITEDLMVFNVDRERITVREALVGDKVIGERKRSIADKVSAGDRIPMSQWLKDGEMKFEGIDTTVR